MLDILFAHPLVHAFTNWDFTDGAWLGAPAGLIRMDGSKKPAYEALKEKVKKDWHTCVSAMTDEEGKVQLDGYLGLYEITCDEKKASFTLCKNAASAELMME